MEPQEHDLAMELHQARMKTEELLQQPFYMLAGKVTLTIDYEQPIDNRWTVRYGALVAQGATPAQAVTRFNQVWRLGRYES